MTLLGCSSELYDVKYGSDVRMFVEPNASGILDSEVIPGSNSVSDVPTAENATGTASTGDQSEGIALGETLPTNPGIHDVTFNVIEGIFYGRGFNLVLPPEMRTNATVMLTIEQQDGQAISYYDFYYVQEGGARATVLSLISVNKNYYLRAESFVDAINHAESSDEQTVFLLKELLDPLSEDFTDTDAYLSVYQSLANNTQSITVY